MFVCFLLPMTLLWTQCISNRLVAASFGFPFSVISVSCQHFGSLWKNNRGSVLPFASSCITCLFFWWASRFLTLCTAVLHASCRFYWGQTFWQLIWQLLWTWATIRSLFLCLWFIDLHTSWVQFFGHLVPFCLLLQVDSSWFLVAFHGSYINFHCWYAMVRDPWYDACLINLVRKIGTDQIQGVSLTGWVFYHLGHSHAVKQILESGVRCRGTTVWSDSSIFPVHAREVEIAS